MTQAPSDYLTTSSPYNYEQPLPAVARTNFITQVPLTKKITFFKSGDPQFGGVKMAINPRSFKSFNALMDDLSHRVPLPFGVRTVTTPRGIHCISALDQLEDGGCYLCSDKKYVKPFSIGTGRRGGPQWNGRPVSALRKGGQEGRREDHSRPFSQQGPKILKKITLVKNGDIGVRRSIILNHRNARSFKTLLDEISELLQFTVKKLYTVDGKKIDSLQALLHCPSMLVCVGREPFKPLVIENSRKRSAEKLPGLASQSSDNNISENNGSKKDVNFGLKAKKSVIHPRSASSNRSMRFSLSSEKSYANGLNTSLENGAPFPNNCPHGKAGDLVHSLVNDDIEKRVHVNKDGSLSVEMKVRFRLLNDETLQWSTQIKKSNLMSKMPCEESGVEEDNGVDPMQKMNLEVSSEAEDSLYPCDADSYISKFDESESEETHCHSCGKQHQDYDIWKNPMHASQKEEPDIRKTWHTRSSCSSTSSRRRVVHKKMTSVESIHTTSSEEYSEHIMQESSCYSETIENRVEYCNIKKCNYRSALSTASSNREESQEYIRMNTSSSQKASSLGPVSHSSCENNLDPEEAVDEVKVSKTDSQNEDENCMEVSSVKCSKEEMDEIEGSRVGSSLSRSSLHSRQSKKSMCEETNSVARTMSSCSLKKAEEEDIAACSSSAHSVYSRSSKYSVPREKSDQDKHSDNDPVISSFSSESCPKEDADEKEAKQEDHKDNEVSSVSAQMVPSDSLKDDFSKCERCSTEGSSHSKACDGNSRRSDSGEILVCNASCSSRTSKRSKHSKIHLDACSEMSMSSLGSTSKKKKKNSLHAEVSRSNSKASNYSKSSCEIKKNSVGNHTSHSDSLPSSTSSMNEAVAPPINNEDQSTSSTSKCYSKSSKGTRQGSQSEESGKMSSPSSSLSKSNGNDGEGNAKVSSETPSSRHGSMSESLCSKCDQTTEAGNGYPPSSSSRVSSYSDIQGQCAETQVFKTSNDGCSQSSVTRSSKPRRKKMKNLHAEVENSSRASGSEVASMYNLHCPAPPKGKPSSKKIRSVVFKNSSSTSACTESMLTEDKEQKVVVNSSRPTSSGSKSAETNTMKAAENNSDDEQKKDGGSCKEKMKEKLQEASAPEEDDHDLAPSALPNTSPEEVVQEWLSKIPQETLLMKYEMEDDGEEECAETTTEISNCANNQEISEEETAEKEDAGEGENGVEEEMKKEAAEANAANEGAEECPKEEKTSQVTSEGAETNQAECSQSIETSSQNNNKKDLPSTIQTSVQIMKALLSSKQEAKFDRSNSLPEVSPTMGRKLSNSANILITCLASLQLLDEEPLGPSDKPKCLNKPRYTELLNIFQALWFGCTVEKGGPSSGQPGSDQTKMNSGFKDQNSTYKDFTPMSSSGVDVSSGSGDSGSVASARDCTLLPQKTVKSKSAEQGASLENEPELSETKGHDKEGEECSRPSTSCSKSKEEDEAESTGADSPERGAEADPDKDDQGSNCENGEGGENEVEENSKLDENEGEAEAEAGDEIPPEANADEATEQPSNTAEIDANADDANCEKEAESNLEEEVGKGSPSDQEANVKDIPETSVKTYSITPQKSVDPNPVWVLRLLKKIEKEFMTHYVSAMNEFKIRWNLENNELLDKMISELKDEVSKRIQKSIEKELRKIKSRAGQRTPRPPDETLRRESTIQTEQRRQRLQTMRNRSLFNDRNMTQSKQPGTTDLSFDIDEEDFGLSTALADDVSEQPSEEEYCPCDTCIRKKMASKPIRNPVVAANAPVMKAFDLKQILRGNETENKMVDCASEAVQDREVIPSEHMQEAEEETNPNEEDGEYEPDHPEQKLDADDEKEPEQHETDEQVEQEVNEDETAAPAEGDEISDHQNCEVVTEEEEEDTEKEEEVVVEEETKEEDGEVKEEEENEEEEMKQEEGNEEEEQEEGNEEEEVKQEEENEEEELKQEERDEEVKQEEENEEEEQEEGNGEVEEEEKEEEEETQNEDQESEKEPKAEEEAEGGVEEAAGEVDGDDNEENASECEENAEVSEAVEDSEEAATGRNEEAEQEPQADAGDEAVEEASPEVECEACSEAPAAEEENESEGDTERAQNGDEAAEAAGEEPKQDNNEDRDARNSEVPEVASDATGDQDCSKGPETLTKAATFSCNSSMGNCSQQSQKGSEDGSEGECRGDGNLNEDPDREANSDGGSKPAKMYPDSEEDDEEEDRPSSCTSPVDGEKNGADDADSQNNVDTNNGQETKKKAENGDEIDQDDLDF
ncbi:retinitis pigmentosa 1-like 1 protein [Mauremys reevesii]|uniref:retinitis pigmentosa 1-like 1 protein n=1 Tax=Mauremys reevesii TaxID=260615 RepID=UPI00193F6D52|nr:retinitis pigmentosa 1-like 1 protein [Mauremys reevesii]